MTTTPDKCPKCGRDRYPDRTVEGWTCGTVVLQGATFISNKCREIQRANREHERAEKWKALCLAYRQQYWLSTEDPTIALNEECDALMKE